MEEHNITDSRWQVAWLAESLPSHTLTLRRGQSTFLLSWQRARCVEEGFVFRVLQLVCSGEGWGPGGCKGHSCTNNSLPWDGGQRIAHFCLTVKGQDVGLVQSPLNISNGANLLLFLPSVAVNTAHHHTTHLTQQMGDAHTASKEWPDCDLMSTLKANFLYHDPLLCCVCSLQGRLSEGRTRHSPHR